jgi:hypothetical protein
MTRLTPDPSFYATPAQAAAAAPERLGYVLLGTGATQPAHAHGSHAVDQPAAAITVGEGLLAVTVHVGAMLAS